MNRKDLLGLRGMSETEITRILDTATYFQAVNQRRIKKVPTLRGRTVVMAFFENSTRTKLSFELAAKRLSADILSFSASTSSTKKGETLMDTARNIDAMAPAAMIIRHGATGAPHMLAQEFPWSVINAGDGVNEHPSQALLDMLTMRDALGELKGKHVAIVGDVRHSRVARSNIFGLQTMGAEVTVAGPGTMTPVELNDFGVRRAHRIDDVLESADVIMMLRIQNERLGRAMLPSIKEYAQLYGMDMARLNRTRPSTLLLHPGPINRGVECDPDAADSPKSAILDQVSNGIAVRMALLYLLLGGEPMERQQ